MWWDQKDSQAVLLFLVGCVMPRRAEPTSECVFLERFDQYILPVSWLLGRCLLGIMPASTPDKGYVEGGGM